MAYFCVNGRRATYYPYNFLQPATVYSAAVVINNLYTTNTALNNGGYFLYPLSIRISNDGAAWSAPVALSTNADQAFNWTLDPAEGAKIVHVKYFTDLAGTDPIVSRDSSLGFNLDLQVHPPTGSIWVTTPSSTTRTQSVAFSLTSLDVEGDSAISMRFSNDAGVNWSPWEAFAANKNWAVSAGDGLKTVYVEFKDKFNYTGVYSTQITLDTSPPVATFEIQESMPGYVASQQVTILVSGYDQYSPISRIYLSNDNLVWTPRDIPPYFPAPVDPIDIGQKWTLTSGDGEKTVYAKFEDQLGNISAVQTQLVTLLSAVPTVTITSAPAAVTNSISNTLEFTASVPGSIFELSLNNGAYGPAASPYTFDGVVGVNTVNIRAISLAGGVGAIATASFTIDLITGVAVLSGAPLLAVDTRDADITVGGANVATYKYQINSGGWSAEFPVATHITLSALDGYQLLEVLGRTAGGVWQIAPTTAEWTVVIGVFDAEQAFGFSLDAELELYPLAESDQGFTFALEAEVDWTPVQTFRFNLESVVSGGTPASVFDAAQTFKQGLSSDFYSELTQLDVGVDSDQAFTFGVEADLLVGQIFESALPFTFALDASAIETILFESNQTFKLSVDGDVTFTGTLNSSQAFIFDIAAQFLGPQQFDSSQGFRFSLNSLFAPNPLYTDTRAYVVNCKTKEGAEYDNFLFTAVARQASNYFGMNSSGLHQLTGKKDIDASINARLVSGISDLGSRFAKFFPDIYIWARCEGNLQLTVTVDEIRSQTYLVDYRDSRQGAHTKRVKLGRGINGREVQIELTNINGASLELSELQLEFFKTKRT